MKSKKKAKCIFDKSGSLKSDYVENGLNIGEQLAYKYNGKKQIITASPFILSQFRSDDVLIYEDGVYEIPDMETYGTDPMILIKHLFEVYSLTPRAVVNEIREQLKQADEIAAVWIKDNIGPSMEKAYLLKKLEKRS